MDASGGTVHVATPEKATLAGLLGRVVDRPITSAAAHVVATSPAFGVSVALSTTGTERAPHVVLPTERRRVSQVHQVSVRWLARPGRLGSLWLFQDEGQRSFSRVVTINGHLPGVLKLLVQDVANFPESRQCVPASTHGAGTRNSVASTLTL